MNLKALKILPPEWEAEYGLESHADLFGEEFAKEERVYDFVVLIQDGSTPLCYSLVKELDKESAYLPYGGTFSSFRGQGRGVLGFKAIIETLKKQYKRIGYATMTTNHPMIKLGLNEKFSIVGMRLFKGKPTVELLLEIQKGA